MGRLSAVDIEAIERRQRERDYSIMPKLGASARDVEQLRQQLLRSIRSR
jgi:hypothetical protein